MFTSGHLTKTMLKENLLISWLSKWHLSLPHKLENCLATFLMVASAITCQVVNEPADVHCPVVEMPTRSKLSCLSWNKFVKNQIASSDYEGIVTVWDVNTRQVLFKILMNYDC